MSLNLIQDNLVKIDLATHIQSRHEEANRTQETVHVVTQQEQNRQADQVVLTSRESERADINPDEERARQEQEKKRRRHNQESGEEEEEESNPHATMHRINIVV